VTKTSPLEEKIKRLEDENKMLMQRIKRNQLEIQKLKSNDRDDNENDDENEEEEVVKPPVKCVGKCLL